MNERRYAKLTADKEEDTKIIAGHEILSIRDIEKDPTNDIRMKLRSVEKYLDRY